MKIVYNPADTKTPFHMNIQFSTGDQIAVITFTRAEFEEFIADCKAALAECYETAQTLPAVDLPLDSATTAEDTALASALRRANRHIIKRKPKYHSQTVRLLLRCPRCGFRNAQSVPICPDCGIDLCDS